MPIIGTAGHVDHGKSSLVLALTGHNPDRLLEEQQRGMTLDLGFAPLRFADGTEAGIIDVPGHERFLHNMLAGAIGMELLLLVVAANEGPKPQTLEHLQILNFLNVQRAIIILTKVDLVDPQQRQRVMEEIRAAVRGTVAEHAPVMAVSTVTGEGLEPLKTAINAALAALPPRRADAPAYLPVDRVFALPGHGTIITGTLLQGSIRSGQTLSLQPSGLPARIKSLQTFGRKREEASAGSRLAVNLPGISVDQIARGETLVAARQFEPQREFAVIFTPIGSALTILRKRISIRAHIGSAEIPGTLRFASGVPKEAAPVHAVLSLTRAVVAYPGMRLIVRRLSPKNLLGGASVHGTATADALADNDVLASAPKGTPAALAVLRSSGLRPLSLDKVAAQVNLVLDAAEAAVRWLLEDGEAVALHKPAEYLAAEHVEAAWQRVQNFLRQRHTAAPWKVGVSATELATIIDASEQLTLRLLSVWSEDGRIVGHATRWRLPDFRPALTKSQQAFFEGALKPDQANPLLPHSFATLSDAIGATPDLHEALESLFVAGALVRIGDDIYRRSQIERAKSAIAAAIAQNGAATMAQMRDALGTSRKYALPLMEFFDSAGFTIRDGDLRRLRGQ